MLLQLMKDPIESKRHCSITPVIPVTSTAFFAQNLLNSATHASNRRLSHAPAPSGLCGHNYRTVTASPGGSESSPKPSAPGCHASNRSLDIAGSLPLLQIYPYATASSALMLASRAVPRRAQAKAPADNQFHLARTTSADPTNASGWPRYAPLPGGVHCCPLVVEE